MLDSQISIHRSNFRNISIKGNGSIINFKNNENKNKIINISYSLFIYNTADTFGGVFFFQSKLMIVILNFSNCFFTWNRANIGGVLYFENIEKILLNKCKFYKNVALSSKKYNNISRGGVFYSMNQSSISNYSLISCLLQKNKAQIGGIFYNNIGITTTILNQNNNMVLNNKVKFYGDNFASKIRSIKFIKNFELHYNKLRIMNIASSRREIFFEAFISGFDNYQSAVYMTNEKYNIIILQIYSETNKNFSNSIVFLFKNGFLFIK